MPPHHRLAASRGPIALTEAAVEPLIVLPNVAATAALEAACAERGVIPRVVVEADNLVTARRMVESGLGVALLPRLVTQSQKGRFVAVEISRGGLKRQVALVHRGEAYLSAAAKALRGTLVERLAATKARGAPK